jgi:hypothetical protein
MDADPGDLGKRDDGPVLLTLASPTPAPREVVGERGQVAADAGSREFGPVSAYNARALTVRRCPPDAIGQRG